MRGHTGLVACAAIGAVALAARAATAAPAVWVVDDGEKVKRDATSLPLAAGTGNPVWSPGQPVKLFALRNETVALQVVVAADASPLAGVTVDLPSLAGPGGAAIANDPGATDPTRYVGRRIERFVEHYFQVQRASGGSTSGESLGWSRGAAPPSGEWTGWMPDALVPVEAAPSWEPYPMAVAAQSNAVVWIDVTVPATQAPGTYAGTLAVASSAGPLASIPVELEVISATLPDAPAVGTMLYYDPGELSQKMNDPAAEASLWMLLHRHRLSAMHDAESTADVTRALPALDGSQYTAANGYEGPGEGQGDGILSLGAYGALGAPTSSTLSTVEGMADLLSQKQLFGTTTTFVYAIDETCGSSYGATWKQLLAGSSDPAAKSVLVGWTCSQDPSSQPVDVPIVMADSYDPQQAAAARAAGKRPWIYNGVRPQTDAFFTDTAAVAPRAQGWIAASAGIERWFYWETTFWFDDNKGGHGAYDPFVTPETFHNSDGDWCEGDGVLLYPGKQVDQFSAHSVGLSAVLPSIRLKNLRRGVEDAGYYQLAHAAAPQQAEAVAQGLLGAALSSAAGGKEPAWPEAGAPWFAARQALAKLLPLDPVQPGGGDAGAAGSADAAAGGGAGAGVDAGAAPGAGADGGSGSGAGSGAAPGAAAPSPAAAGSCGCTAAGNPAGWGGGLLAAALALLLAQRRRLHHLAPLACPSASSPSPSGTSTPPGRASPSR